MKLKGALMVQGTCSGAGKSLLVAGLARILSDEAVSVAPFKSQNMALNSFITEDGAEIGRAQALQAEAARVKPHSDMNPILLKARGEQGCQVIIKGRVHSNMTAREYYAFRDRAWGPVAESFERLREKYDVVLIEGAGSPAEINLRDEEIVNMRVARHAGSPVLLVGDIDRGGVFASFYGTIGLLDGDARLIKGFVINKFRGDRGILAPGLDLIKQKTGVPVVGVLPWAEGLDLDEEDGLSLSSKRQHHAGRGLRVAVVRVDYISNFTDFSPLMCEPDVNLVFTKDPREVESADLVILPGSKNTARDLLSLTKAGLDESIRRAARKGTPVVGICGGYQMLGTRMLDPLGVESDASEVRGIGLLDVETEIKGEKVTSQTAARADLFGFKGEVRGYEIHMGETRGDTGLFRFRRLATEEAVPDGSMKGNVWGTYLHGIFDNDGFRDAFLDSIREAKGLPVPERRVKYSEVREERLDRWASLIRENLDMEFVRGLLC